MSTAALFTVAKTWKQPKCPLTDEWTKKMWYICTMEYYSAIKVESSAYLRLLIYLLAILIPACNSFSQAFHIMYPVYIS